MKKKSHPTNIIQGKCFLCHGTGETFTYWKREEWEKELKRRNVDPLSFLMGNSTQKIFSEDDNIVIEGPEICEICGKDKR